MRRILLIALALAGCATAPAAVRPPLVPEDRRPESRALPEDPGGRKADPDGEWVEPLEQGTPAPKPGLLVSEGRASRDLLFRISYRELRQAYESDRLVFGAHREFYEERLRLARDEIERLQPGWWDANQFKIGVVGGILAGAALSVAVLKATTSVR